MWCKKKKKRNFKNFGDVGAGMEALEQNLIPNLKIGLMTLLQTNFFLLEHIGGDIAFQFCLKYSKIRVKFWDPCSCRLITFSSFFGSQFSGFSHLIKIEDLKKI